MLVKEVQDLNEGDCVRVNGQVLRLDGERSYAEIEDRRARCYIDFSLIDPDRLHVNDWYQFIGDVTTPGVIRARVHQRIFLAPNNICFSSELKYFVIVIDQVSRRVTGMDMMTKKMQNEITKSR